jgi:hypothetical protein
MSVPFAFMVGDKTLPAGEYLLQFDFQSKLTTLCSPTGPVTFLTAFPDGDGYAKDDALQFHLVGDTWVLQRVRVGGREQMLVPSKFEKRELAKLKPTGRETFIASSVPAR